jgi:hypothetical protein
VDPAAVQRARGTRTGAVLACHLHGVCADIPAVRRLVPDVPILEDAAQAFGCHLDGRLAGTLGDMAVLSLGPGKQIDAGEGGVLLCGDDSQYDAAVAAACHPLRQLLAGLAGADPFALAIRPHPVAAILALDALASWSPRPGLIARTVILGQLSTAQQRLQPIGIDGRRASTQPYLPVLVDSGYDVPQPAGTYWTRSGAQVLPHPCPAISHAARTLLARVRLVSRSDLVLVHGGDPDGRPGRGQGSAI